MALAGAVSDYAVGTRRELPAAFWGMAMFVAGEATLFGMMIGSYFLLRFKNLHWPPPGIPEPKVAIPLILLGVLLLALAPTRLAYVALRAGRLGSARLWLLVALVVQAGYFAMSVHEYAGDLSRFTPQTHAYGSIYFLLLGADHAHVGLGLLFDLWLLAKLAGGVTEYRRKALFAIAFYWYAVGVITTAVTLTVLSPAL
jgi:heme/copper-type cytochrome/quinol oxidase subunit 3